MTMDPLINAASSGLADFFSSCWTTVTKEDINKHFEEGPGTIGEIKIMNGFGFLEYNDPADARDVVPRKS